MTSKITLMRSSALGVLFAFGLGAVAQAQTAPADADVAAQIRALQAQVQALQARLDAQERAQAAAPVATAAAPAPAQPVAWPAGAAQPVVSLAAAEPTQTPAAASAPAKAWYERLQLRGYTQLRYNGVLSGDDTAPTGVSRLRSVHDASISEDGGFSLRRVRTVLQGDITDRISLYLQHDFGAAVNNQSSTERREHFGQLRDAYVDVFADKDHRFRLRFGQSKVPFGWENLQSSSNRLTLDRSDAINSGVPGERDLGVVAYYTPPQVQAVWDRLAKDGQKLFGNYGAFGVGVYNGQGTNRTERNGSLMTVAMATWPFELDALGDLFEGQVLELGGSALLNKVRPELRSGGVSAVDYDDERVGLHAILYPQPFGIQAEWTWGRAPEFDTGLSAIREKKLNGGYVQLMYDVGETGVGKLIPYARWQRYRGGWKASVNAPRLETDEVELGVEWQFMKALEFTAAYAHMKRREADERRAGRAEGDLVRAQLQWNY
jgi:phosphate-selective porin